MKTIYIKTLKLRNFKGIKELILSGLKKEVVIKGANASGKTTIADAFSWLFFDKDSHGRHDFEIKPLTESGEPIHQVDSEVSAELLVGDEKIVLTKIYHEKWTKPRGQPEQVFSGHETLYYFNGVPVTMREYNAKIEDICPESLFRLLTNPLYFPKIPWQEQRQMLFNIAGTISDLKIASQSKAWMDLINHINARKTMDEYKREIAAEKRKIRDDLDRIPARIDEVQKSIPEKEEDWPAIEKAINDKSEEIKAIDKEIADISAGMDKEFAEYRARQTEINEKKSVLQDIEFEVQKEASRKYHGLLSIQAEKQEKIKDLQAEFERLERSAKNMEQEKDGYINDREGLRRQWQELNKAREVFFLDDEFICPTCKRPLDDSDIEAKKEKLTAQYNEDKAKKIARNIASGKELTTRIDIITETLVINKLRRDEITESIADIEAKLKAGEQELAKAKSDSSDWQSLLDSNTDYKRIKDEVQKLEEALGAEPARADIDDQASRKWTIHQELKDLIERLNNRQFIKRAKERIKELAAEQKDLAQKLADLEKVEYNIQGFIRAKIEAVESKVNSMFALAKFKMFDQQVNGEQVEACEITVDGVPWSDLNNSMKINSGVDVVKTLSNHYGIYPPVFFDNAEAINEIISMDAQTIKLYVTEDKELIISN